METLLKELKNNCEEHDKLIELKIDEEMSNYEYLIHEFELQKKFQRRLKISKTRKIKNKLKRELFFLDILANITHNLFFTFQESMNNDLEIIEKNFGKGYRSPDVILLFLFSNLYNSLNCIRDSVINGTDYQANVLARTYLEISDITTAFLGNEDFRKSYCKIYDDKNGKINEKFIRKLYENYTKPSKIKEIIDNSLEQINFNKDFREIIKTKKKNYYYNHLSGYSHGEPLSILFDAFPFNEDINDWDYNPFGGYSILLERTILDLTFYATINLLYSIEFLEKIHSYTEKVSGDQYGQIIRYKLNVFKRLFIGYYFKKQNTAN